uniref:C-type lectin domain-containing protein n=1 Tax=Panagrolaimus sp. JU765 TaxID=591449 RepID=A0AC34QG13_9BILA
MVSTNAGPAATYMNRQAYIGLELAATAGTVYTYAWNDGTPVDFPTGNPWTMNMGPLPWDPTFGNPDGIPCVFIYNNNNGIPGTAALGEWNDVTCSTPLYSYICKKPLI